MYQLFSPDDLSDACAILRSSLTTSRYRARHSFFSAKILHRQRRWMRLIQSFRAGITGEIIKHEQMPLLAAYRA
jgi:hypothetical protein